MVRVVPEGRVAFGIQLPVQAPSADAEAWEADAGPGDVVDVARVAEHAGFAHVAACDHVAVPKSDAGALGVTWWDTVATLSYVAALTSRIRLLSHVSVLPTSHPLRVAKQWATLDMLSGGRVILGVGAGEVRGELAALGIDPARRGDLLDEAIDAVRVAFADEYSSHEGEAWAYHEMGVSPRRGVEAEVPIWVGGSSPAAIARAADAATVGCPTAGRRAGCRPPCPHPRPAGGRRAGRPAVHDRRHLGPALRRRADVGHRAGRHRLPRAGRRLPEGAGRPGRQPDPGWRPPPRRRPRALRPAPRSAPRWPRSSCRRSRGPGPGRPAGPAQIRLRPPSTARVWPVT